MVIHFIVLFLAYFFMCLSNTQKSFYDSNQNILLDEHIMSSNREKKNKKKYFIASFVIMVTFLGLRDITIGTDTATYVSKFLRNDYTYSNIEIMFPILNYIIQIFTSKYYIYLSIIQAIILIGIFYNMKIYSFNREMFIFLYITSFSYIYSSSAMRFFCAFSIIMISFKYMIEREDKKVIMLIIMASLFHTSAIFFIPVYYFSKFKLTPYFVIFTFLLSNIINISINIIDFEVFLGLLSLDKYTYILDKSNQVGGMSVFINIFILVFIIIYRPIVKIYKKDFDFFVKMHFISMFLDFFTYGYRLVWYFRFPIWFIAPIVLMNLKYNKKRKYEYIIIYTIFIIAYLIYYYILLKTSLHSHNFLNYIFNSNLN